jgi:anthranilate synthase/aminodeoxychorismate synthase-like glutamine amidotransferase
MILLLDNYDSFTFNLYQALRQLGAEVTVRRNDKVSLDDIEALAPTHIVISPGPGRPEDAGLTPDVVRYFGERLPLLGVCLGHQAIGLAFGGEVVRAPLPIHGVQFHPESVLTNEGRRILRNFLEM